MFYEIGTLHEYGPIFAWKEDPAVVRGGYYLTNNEDIRPNTINQQMNLGAFTQYHSLADGNTFPGWNNAYLNTLMSNGVMGNFVLELKHYGALQGSQRFAVEGVDYLIPAPNMVTQRRPNAGYAISYGYTQVTTGVIDGLLHRAAYQLSLLPKNAKVNIQLASEVDTDNEFGVKIGSSSIHPWESADAMALTAYGYIVGYIRDYLSTKPDAPFVTFSLGMGGFDKNSWIRMHPEWIADLFDYQHYNVYRRSVSQTAEERFYRTKFWSDNELPQVWAQKDILIGEWGTPASLGQQAAWISTVGTAINNINIDALQSNTGQIVMANYFDSNPDWATLQPRQQGLDALKELYRQPPFTA